MYLKVQCEYYLSNNIRKVSIYFKIIDVGAI